MTRTPFSSLFSTEENMLSGFTFENTALAEAVRKAKEAKTNRATERATALLGQIDSTNNRLLTLLRNARKVEKQAKKGLEAFKKAVQHFLNSGNPGPLYPHMPVEIATMCRDLGVDTPTEEDQKLPE